ncbi:MAG: hypothetical protein HC859_02920, partial [Bacteroidia bacterium]|nr:hypothetical protein [Bacteroidia bacterium]
AGDAFVCISPQFFGRLQVFYHAHSHAGRGHVFFASGRPYHNPNQSGFNNSTTRSYHDLSVNFAYLPKPNLIVYLSCTNVLGYRNVFGYEFADQPDDNGVYAGRAVTQPARRFLFVGIFITLSKDKTTNQLPSL